MPSNSPFPDVEIPDVDLWGFMFEWKDRDFSDDKVIYRAINSDRKYTFAQVKDQAKVFGEGLLDLGRVVVRLRLVHAGDPAGSQRRRRARGAAHLRRARCAVRRASTRAFCRARLERPELLTGVAEQDRTQP